MRLVRTVVLPVPAPAMTRTEPWTCSIASRWRSSGSNARGRELDFAPHDPQTPRLRTFGLLHAAYTLLDAIEMILGIIVTVWLMRRKES